MGSGSASRIMRGIGAGFIMQSLNFGSKIVLPPLFISHWGVESYGDWLLIISLAGYLGILDFGGQIYVMNRLNHASSTADSSMFSKILQTALVLYIFIPFIGVLLLITAINLISISEFLRIKIFEPDVVNITLIILGIQFALTQPIGILSSIYQATGKLARGMMLANAITIIQLLFIYIGLWFNLGAISIALLQLAINIIWLLLILFDLKYKYLDLKILSFNLFDYKLAKSFLSPSFDISLIQLSQSLTLMGVVMMVGIALGSLQVVIYTTLRTISSGIRQIVSLISNASFSEMAMLHASERGLHLNKLFIVVQRITMAIGALMTAIFLVFGESLYAFWLGRDLSLPLSLLTLMLLYTYQAIFWMTSSNFLLAINQQRKLAKVYILWGMASFLFANIGGRIYGLNGVFLGLLIADFIIPFWYIPILANKYLENRKIYDIYYEILFQIFILSLVLLSRYLIIIMFIIEIYIISKCLKNLRFYEK